MILKREVCERLNTPDIYEVSRKTFDILAFISVKIIEKIRMHLPQILGVTEKEFFDQMGVHFVGFVGQYGYDRVLSVLGRHVRDFLNGLDNLHEYLKFSYPRMRAPSFICENETRQGECSKSQLALQRENSFVVNHPLIINKR